MQILTDKETSKKDDRINGRLFTVPILLGIALLFVIVLIGAYISITIYNELTGPEREQIKEIGAPPHLDLMAVTVGIVTIVCGLALKFGGNENKENH